jgi:hypothetical protein
MTLMIDLSEVVFDKYDMIHSQDEIVRSSYVVCPSADLIGQPDNGLVS